MFLLQPSPHSLNQALYIKRLKKEEKLTHILLQSAAKLFEHLRFFSGLIANFYHLTLVYKQYYKRKNHLFGKYLFHKTALGVSFLMRIISSVLIILLLTVNLFKCYRKKV